MASDLGTLTVLRVIVHEIPPRPVRPQPSTASGPVLSEIDSPLTPGLKNYFRERIITTLTEGAYSVLFDAGTASPVPGLVLDHLYQQNSAFVALSQQIANHLYKTQTLVNPAGLLIVADVTVASIRSLAILKLEREEGVRVQQSIYENKPTFNIEHLRDLMLTQKTRVFKAGLFVGHAPGPDGVEGVASDTQRGYRPKTEVADFFLKKFLGCTLLDAPDVTTKKFFTAAEGFINEKVTDPFLKARYQIALLAEMNDSRSSVRVKQFAQSHLRVPDRQRFVSHLREQGVAKAVIQKDVSLIAPQLHRLQISFQSGIAVLASPSSFDAHVKMEKLGSGKTRLQIEDTVKEVHGRR